jgi:vancomycin resistance protein VanJ
MQSEKRQNGLAIPTFINLTILLLLVILEGAVAERHWFTTLLTYMPQQPFCLPTAVLLVVVLYKRQWRWAAVNGLAAAICVFLLLGVNVPLPRGGTPGTPVRVMTFNIHHLSGGIDAVAGVIEREGPDILCLQEANPGRYGNPVSQLTDRLLGWHVARSHDVAVFSRYPIRERRVHPVPGTERAMLETVFQVEGRRFAVLNIHMSTSSTASSQRSPHNSRRTYLRMSAAIRSRQVRMMLDIVDRSAYPMLIAGDFNLPPRGRLYRRLREQFDDAFGKAGWGTGYTFPARLPVMRIDYIFADRSFAIRRCYRPSTTASDHHAMVADLVIGEPLHPDDSRRGDSLAPEIP